MVRNGWVLVLAGGDGRRLQELTRRIVGMPIPKQYCRIIGDHSLLEATLERTAHFAPRERTLVIVNREHLAVGWRQLRALPRENVLVHPCNRDTGPGLLLSLLQLARRDAAATVAIFPSDHYVGDNRAFMAHVDVAGRLVEQFPERVVMLGIRPNRPDTGLGYVIPAGPLCAPTANGAAFYVQAFEEKPDVTAARALLVRGALWNSFVMVARVRRILQLLKDALSTEFERICAFEADPEARADDFGALRAWNFCKGFLARVPQHLIVLRVDGVYWSDWGTPQAIEETLRTLNHPAPWWAQAHTAPPLPQAS